LVVILRVDVNNAVAILLVDVSTVVTVFLADVNAFVVVEVEVSTTLGLMFVRDFRGSLALVIIGLLLVSSNT
jgi:hypothetical protein